MILPVPLQVANAALAASRAPHDAAVTWTLRTTEWLVAHPTLPDAVERCLLAATANALLLGDSAGHVMLTLYVWVITHL